MLDRLDREHLKYFSCYEMVGKFGDTVIFTLTMGRLDYTKRMVESLEKTMSTEYTHVFVDQGSTDDTTEYLRGLSVSGNRKGVLFFGLTKNIGISAGSNLVLDILDTLDLDTTYICKIDNDCELLTVGWDGVFKYITDQVPSIVLSPYVEGLRENKGGAERYSHSYLPVGEELIDVGLTTHLGGICEFSRATAYQGFRFNEEDTLSGSQDSSFSAHVISQGYLMGYVENCKCLHMDTTDGQHQKYPEYFKKRAEYDSKVTLRDVKHE